MEGAQRVLENLLKHKEGRTLEFKRSCLSLEKILQTVVAFANTAGGKIVIGIDDVDRTIIGVSNVLKEEERLANAVADSVYPLLLPLIDIYSYRDKEIIVVRVPCGCGPYYLKTAGEERGVYVRLGSTNRVADSATLENLKRIAMRVSYDELPCLQDGANAVDWNCVEALFKRLAKKSVNVHKRKDLGLITSHNSHSYPTNAAMVLFGKRRGVQPFPDAMIRCARFKGVDKAVFIDHQDIDANLIESIEIAEAFVRRHTLVSSKIGKIQREDVPEYPSDVIREALINAVLHADYSLQGCTITIAIFDNRIEISNPGGLPHGMTIEHAKQGSSKIRNKTIANVLKNLNFIEQWGSGMQRMIAAYAKEGAPLPHFEEIGHQFRVTIYSTAQASNKAGEWETQLVKYLEQHKSTQSKDAAKLWEISDRAARTRLSKLVDQGVVVKLATSKSDPQVKYVLAY